MITITQSANSSRDEIIHILSTNGIGGIDYASSRPMKAILDNHFGVGKTIQLGGIEYSQIPITINETNWATTAGLIPLPHAASWTGSGQEKTEYLS